MPRRTTPLLPVLLALSALPSFAHADFAKIGDRVPDFALPKLVGGDGQARLSDYFGRPVLFAYWLDAGSGMDAARRAMKSSAVW